MVLHYTKIGPMPRISALYPGACAPDTDCREVFGAHGIQGRYLGHRPNSYIRGIRAQGYRQISGAYDPGSLRATLMPQHLEWNKSEMRFLSWCFK